MRTFSKTIGIMSGIAVVALVFTGCANSSQAPTESGDAGTQSSSSAPASSPIATPAAAINLPQPPSNEVLKDQSKWTLPADPYLGTYAGSLMLQADSMLTAACMTEAGFPQAIETWDAAAPWPETSAGNEIGYNFTEQTAAKHGYRLAPDPRYLIEALFPEGGILYENESEEFHIQLTKCESQSIEEVKGLDPDRVDVEIPDAASAEVAAQTVESQLNRLTVDLGGAELQTAADQWRTCMAPLGIVDLPDQPWMRISKRPPESLIARWDWTPNGDPSAEEIETAMFDAACQKSSGWVDTYYEAEWNLEETFVNEHKTELDPILQRHQADADRAIAVIKKYSGAE